MDCFSGLRFPPAALRLRVNHEVTARLESSVNHRVGSDSCNAYGGSQIEGDVNRLAAVDQRWLGHIESEEAIFVAIGSSVAAICIGRSCACTCCFQERAALRGWYAVKSVHRESREKLLAVNRERQVSSVNGGGVGTVSGRIKYGRIRVQVLLGAQLIGCRWGSRS